MSSLCFLSSDFRNKMLSNRRGQNITGCSLRSKNFFPKRNCNYWRRFYDKETVRARYSPSCSPVSFLSAFYLFVYFSLQCFLLTNTLLFFGSVVDNCKVRLQIWDTA